MKRSAGKSSSVIEIARGLGMAVSADPGAFLLGYCRRLIDRWTKDYGPRTLHELLETAAVKIGLIIEEIHEDSDLAEVTERYVNAGEGGFARVRSELDKRTFALAIRLRRSRKGCTHVAVIDCRRAKYARRWFSIWHEIVHLMLNPQLELDFRRTTEESKDPVEAMIDKIAGEFAFYPPMYDSPALSAGTISLRDLETHRERLSPEASRESSYATLVSRMQRPALFVVARLALKATEERALHAYKPGDALPIPKLRVIRTAASPTAKPAGLFIPHKYRVPASSIIYRLFEGEAESANPTCSEIENLEEWEDSTGHRLPDLPILVEAMRNGQHVVFALITRAARN